MKLNQSILAIGNMNLLNGIENDLNSIFYLIFEEPFGSQNTQYISFAQSHRIHIVVVKDDKLLFQKRMESTIFKSMLLDSKIIESLHSVGLFTDHDLSHFVPLFLLTWEQTVIAESKVEVENAHIHSMLRFSEDDALFIQTTISSNIFISESDCIFENIVNKLIPDACLLHNKHQLFINNHQCYYHKYFEGMELENKFVLDSNHYDIWALTVECYKLIKSGNLNGYILEYKDEFQAWDYLNYLFEVIEPNDQVGYISIIPTTDDKYTIKRKWYLEDQFMRREEHYNGQLISDEMDFKKYIEHRFNVKVKAYPPFRRVRYDVNFESVKTGHIYGIFFDHSSIVGLNNEYLVQCEIEYLRSRTLVHKDQQVIINELKEITNWTKEFMNRLEVEYKESYYSKLSFLRDRMKKY